MLSVVPIKNSSISDGYYLKQDSGYYIENSKDKDLYTWFGKGASNLDLQGGIELEMQSKIFSGELPDGTRMGKRDPKGKFTGRPGYDLTFSANKDISLIICCSENIELKEKLLNLHHSAVKESMGYLEKFISARRTSKGVTRYETTGNMVAALCTHFNSRSNDPDIHTHALLANMTECADGKWRSLSTDMSRQHGVFEIIRDNATLLGHIYQNEIEKGVKELGFETEPIYKHGMFKIKNFPDEMRQHFSKRREQIVQIVRGLGNANQHDKKIFFDIAKNSRGAKFKIDTKNFIALSKHSMQDYLEKNKAGHLNFDGVIASLKVKTKENTSINDVTIQDVKNSIDSMSRFSTKLSTNRVIEKAFENSKTPLELKNIQEAINKLTKTNYISTNGSYIETQKNKLDAQHLIQITNSIKDQISIEEQPSINKEAMKQLSNFIRSKESMGKKVIILASNSRYASDHNQYARDMQKTIWQKLSALGKLDSAVSINQFTSRIENYKITKKHTLIIDDAQRADLQTVQTLLDIAKKTGCEIVLSEFNQGRRSQLAGNALQIIKETGVIDSKKNISVKSINCDVGVIECKPEDLINKTKQSEQQVKLQSIVNRAIELGIGKSDVIANNKKEQMQLTSMIRSRMNKNNEITITCHRPVYINDNVNNIKTGMIIKSYVGKGQYKYDKIKRIDRQNEICVINGMFNREKRIPLSSVTGKQLLKEEQINISNGEHIKLLTTNHIANNLRLSKNMSYTVKLMDRNKVLLTPLHSKGKTIRANINKISCMDFSYDYVKTLNDVAKIDSSKKEALVSVPNYGSFNRKLEDIKRGYDKATLFVSDQKLYKKYNDQSVKHKNSEIPEEKSKTQSAVIYAIESISSRNSTFKLEDVVKKSLEYGTNSGVKEIISEIKMKIRAKDIAFKQFSTGSIILATQESLDTERSIINTIQNTKNTQSPYLTQEKIQSNLQGTILTKGQKEACAMIATTVDKFNIVQGYAGTGKSTMLKTLLESLSNASVIDSKDIIALGPTHRSVKELSEKGIESRTIQRFLIDHKDNQTELNNKLIIIDEMSMIGTSTFDKVVDAVKKSNNTKCVILGDNNQLQPVSSGAPSTLAYISKEANINLAVMNEIKRQETPHLKEAVSSILDNSIDGLKKSLGVLEKHGSIVNAPLYDEDTVSKTAITQCAKAYADKSKDERNQTLIITSTNKIRNEINQAVRNELIKKREIQGQAIKVSSLIDSGLTDTELKHSKNYKIGDIVKYANQICTINSIDSTNNRLLVKTLGEQTKSISLNEPVIIEKYSERMVSIQKGDVLKWTKTDYDRDILAHSKLTVINLDNKNNTVRVCDEKGNQKSINMNLHQNRHIDYAYTSTIYGSQGATVKNVLCVLDSSSKQANSINSMYVALTRATHQVSIYTQDTSALVESIAKQKKNEQIALKAFGLLDEKVPKPSADITKTAKDMSIPVRLDAVEINHALKKQATLVCKNLLGEPNKNLSTSQNWRYGTNGSLSVFVDGERKGSFMNFETDEGGDLLKLIMTELGLDFKSALEYASHIIGHTPYRSNRKKSKQPSAIKENHKKPNIDPEKYKNMEKLVSRSSPIQGTVVEKYLKSRGIEPGKMDDIRIIKRVNTGFKNKEIKPFASALLGIARDETGKMNGIQLTYLDPIKGTKIRELPIKKRSVGAIKGSVVELKNTQSKPKYLFAAEGIETGLSIKNALEQMKNQNSRVVATLGVSNFASLDKNTDAKNIVLILDNDGKGSQSDALINKTISKLQGAGKSVITICPCMIDGQKTDYNDLLKAGKMDRIIADIERAFAQKEIGSERQGGQKTEQEKTKMNTSKDRIRADDKEIFG